MEWTGSQGIPRVSNCPQRTRGDAATRSARPPVLPPPPRPPQRRCRHLVSRAGTPRCACAGTAFEGPRRCCAAILSVAGPADSLYPACCGPPPLPPVLPCCSMRVEGGGAALRALGCGPRRGQTHKHTPCLSFPCEHTRWRPRTWVGGARAGSD